MTDRAEAASPPVPLPVGARLIRPSAGWRLPSLREVAEHRTLLFYLVRRDLRTRHSQTLLGLAWLLVYPLMSVAVYTVIFGVLLKAPSDGVPYPLFVLAGVVLWHFFSFSLTGVSTSLLTFTAVLEKVYVPRIIIPIAVVLSRMVDLLASLVVLVVVVFIFGSPPSGRLLLLPAIVVASALTAFGFGLWFAALNIRYRDVQKAMPLLLRLWFFVSPVIYSRRLLPESLQDLYFLNPLVPLLEGLRWVMFGTGSIEPLPTVASALAVAVVTLTGLTLFERFSRNVIDTI